MSPEKPSNTSDWLLFHSNMARMKITARGGERGTAGADEAAGARRGIGS